MTEPRGRDRRRDPGLAPDALAELATRAAAGDPVAVSAVLRALSGTVLRTARGILGAQHPDVEDAAQESLIQIAKALPAFRGDSGVRHYAARIAVRTCLAVKRRSQTRRQRHSDIGDLLEQEEAPPTCGPNASLSARRRLTTVRQLLAELPEAQAETLALRIVLGYSMQECGEITEAPVNTVRSRLRLAKEALRKRVESDPSLLERLGIPR